jgi:lipid-A-disaccharide synthase
VRVTLNGGGRTICIVAGDVSGDQNAGRLAAAIREAAPDVRLVGAGGRAMRAAGVDVAVETTDLSCIGIFDILRRLRQLVSRYRRAQQFISQTCPDLVILVDSETVNLPAAIWLRRKAFPVVFFFPPQVWFWGRWRLPVIVPLIRRVLSAFRDEADLYAAAGADTVWVGHPLRDLVQVNGNAHSALQAIGLDPARPLVVLMPGSRLREIKALAAPFLGAARLLQERDPRLQFALPLASESLRDEIERSIRESGLRGVVVYDPSSYAVLSQARVVLQCSGTATLETALLRIPAVIAYRIHPIEYFFARHILLDVPFIGMPNILLKEMVQPEFFNKRVDAEHLAQEAWSLLTDQGRRQLIQSRLASLRDALGPAGVFDRAAEAVVNLLEQPEVERKPLAAGGFTPAIPEELGLDLSAQRRVGAPKY